MSEETGGSKKDVMSCFVLWGDCFVISFLALYCSRF